VFSYKEIFSITELFNGKVGFAAFFTSGVGGFLTWLYGGTEYNLLCMAALFLAISFDWIGGTVASKKDGSYASAYGIQGLVRTVVMLLLPVFGVLIDNIFQTPNVAFFMFWGGLMYHTLNSMTANFTRAGWDKLIPNWAIDYVSSEIESKINRSNSRVNINKTDDTDESNS
jgi:phage-related holin